MIPQTLSALSRALCRASFALLAICAPAKATPYTVTGSGVINSSSGAAFGVNGESVSFYFTYDDSTFTRTLDGGSYSNYTPATPIPVVVVGSISGPIAVDPITMSNAYNDPGGNFDQWNFYSGAGSLIQANSWSSQGFTSNPGAAFAAVNSTFANGYAAHWSPSDNVSFGKDSLGRSVQIGSATWTITPGVLPPPLVPDKVYVANYWDSNILKYTAPGVYTVFADYNDGISNPEGMAFDSSGNLFVVNSGNGNVVKITPNGTASVFADYNDGITYPTAIAIDAANNVYVGDSVYLSVIKITPSGTATTLGTTNGPSIRGLAVDSLGKVYVAGEGSSIEVLSPTGVLSTYYDGSALSQAYGLTMDSSGVLYCSDVGLNQIVKFTTPSVPTTYASDLLSYPSSIQFGGDGKLYAANLYAPSITTYTTTGTADTYADYTNGVNSPSTIAVYFPGPAVNLAPANITLSPSSIAENNAPGATVGTLQVADPNSGDTHTLSFAAGGADNSSFTLVGAVLKITPSADYEAKTSYAIRVRATDSGGLFVEKDLTVSITDVFDTPAAPTNITLSPSSILENNAPGATVGTLQASDPNPGDTHTFSFATGGADNGSFTLAGAVLRITPSADYETKNSYAIRVRATDSTGLSLEKDLTILITDVFDTAIPGYVVTSPYAPAVTMTAFNGANGSRPSAITRAPDGNYYGPAYDCVFKVGPDGMYTKLASFDYTSHGGQLEGGVVMAGDGNLYGTAGSGGTSGMGTVYRLTPSGAVTKLADFNGSNGAYPCGSLILASDGAMYGLTQQGGANNVGVVYKVTTAGTVSVLASLSSTVGTASSRTGLVQGPDGALYGLGAGGGTYNEGTVFKVTIAGAGSITKLSDLRYSTVGAYPNGTLAVGPDGALYGTLMQGGVSGVGTAVRVTTTGMVTRLVDFTSATGQYPFGALVLAGDGNFYGQTTYGGPHGSAEGTVFRLSPAGVLSVIAYGYRSYYTPGYADAINGSSIMGLAVTEDGSLLGVASDEGPSGRGSIFRLNTFIAPGAGFFVTSGGSYIPAGSTGAFPGNATLIRTESSIPATRTYTLTNRTAAPVTVSGVTKSGSSNISLNVSGLPLVLAPNGTHSFTMTYLSTLSDGDVTVTVASNAPTAPSYQFQVHGRVDRVVKISDMNPATTGFFPRSDLLPDGAGNFYAMTNYGSISLTNKGMAIKVTPSGTITPLAAISTIGGQDPYGEFINGPGGLLYGFTAGGGSGNSGIFFRMTPAGVATTLASLSGTPYGSPVLADDGNFYGLTRFGGGGSAYGSILRITPAGVVTQVFAFDQTTGTRPTGSLIKGNDGALYGMTAEYGANYSGTIFKFTTAGVFTKLVDFNSATIGGYPQEDLIQASDGNFYGITSYGGANGEGTVFRMTPAGVLTKLADLDGSTTGRYPEGSLFEASDGNFYGLTKAGGTGGAGTVFRLTPAGVLTKIADFDRTTTGAEPLGSLVEGSPGLLYGTASRGGTGDYGTIFKVLISVPPSQAPTDIVLSANSMAENNLPGATVGTLAATDPDIADSHSFELAAGGADNGAFAITGASLMLTQRADFETKNSYAIRIRATDPGGLSVEKNFTITITDVNDAPTFAGYSVSTPFQKAASISFGKLLTKASDVEGDALTVTAAGPTSTQGGTAVLQGGSIVYTPATGFSGDDAFAVTITDARGASVIGTVTVSVQINTGIGSNTPVLTTMSGGRMGIGFQGIPGRAYEVQRSTDLNNWTTLTTVTAASNGAIVFIDNSPPSGSGFYRLRRP